MALTAKQEKFAQAYVETGSAAQAYRLAFNAENMLPETIHKRASELLAKREVTGRVNQLQAEAAQRSAVTVDSLIDELEEARAAALSAPSPQASAAVAATMGKAKLLGLDVAKVEMTGKNGGPLQTSSVSTMSDAAAAVRIAEILEVAKARQLAGGEHA